MYLMYDARNAIITHNDAVLGKACYNSQGQGVLYFYSKVVRSCYTIQSVDTNDGLQ